MDKGKYHGSKPNHSKDHKRPRFSKRYKPYNSTLAKYSKQTEAEAAINRKRNETAMIVVKIWFIRLFIILSLMFLTYKIIAIKLEFGDEYTQRAIAQLINSGSESDMVINPNRGAILDRNKQPIAVSSTVYNVFLDVKMLLERSESDVKDGETPEDTIGDTFQIINEVLGTPLEQLYSYLEKNPETGEYIYGKHQYLIFARQVRSREANLLMERRDDAIRKTNKVMRDVYIEAQSERSYIYGTLAPQVIGFLRGDSSWGLERQYNSTLTGTPGRIFQTYTGGGITTDRVDAVEGNSIITTLDLQLQQFVEPLCLEYATEYSALNASVIIMNPNSGEIYAMAESPGFDLNEPMNEELITDGYISNQFTMLDPSSEEYFNRFYRLWTNFNTTSTFEPGSIFKPITIAAALEEGIISYDSVYYCGGSKMVADRTIRCHLHRGHNWQTIDEVLKNSCNIALMEIAAEMGRDTFYKYQRDFGYGEKTGIDLPAEESASALLFTLDRLKVTELATSSFGQRFKCTPIQAITSFAAVINGGILYKPYIVSQITDSRGNVVQETSPTIIRKTISKETSDYLREAMQLVLSPGGTGYRAAISGYAIGGKTGTGEQGIRDTDDYSYSLSFIGYLPVDNPQYLVLALIHEVPKPVYDRGSSSASFMIKEIFQYLIDNKGIKPVDADETEIPPDKTVVGDYVGLTVLEAVHLVNNAELDFELVGGSGTVILDQSLDPGTVVPKGTTVWFTFTIDEESGYTLKAVPDLEGLEPAVAEAMIKDAGFVPILVYDNEQQTTASIDEMPLPDDEGIPPQVYKQMPAAGVSVIEGMEIKVRIR